MLLSGLIHHEYDGRSSTAANGFLLTPPSYVEVRQEQRSNISWLRRPAVAMLLDPNRPRRSTEAASQWDSVRATLAAWTALRNDWDGDDAIAPTEMQFKAMAAFVAGAETRGLREPRPYIASDGETGFHWDGETKGSVSFLPSNRFLVFCPRVGEEPLRIAGPLDIASCSAEMFKTLAALR